MGNVGVKKKLSEKKKANKYCRVIPISYAICPRFTHHDAQLLVFFFSFLAPYKGKGGYRVF